MAPPASQGVLAVMLVFGAALIPHTGAIGCYMCSSENGSDPNCEDPFHPGYSTYSDNCQVPKKNHIGTFPANFCVKIIGTFTDNDESLTVRICVLQNMDSQCGRFKFEKQELSGCILTCSEDGCNTGVTHHPPPTTPFLMALLTSLIFGRPLLYDILMFSIR